MKMQHMVSIDEELGEIARTLPNFSAFVQECLKMYANGDLEIDFSKLEMRKRERERLLYETKIEQRLTKIEEMLLRMQGN